MDSAWRHADCKANRQEREEMQITYDEIEHVTEDELAPEQTRNIPFLGFVAATAISLVLWGAIAWTVWAIVT
jgi:hypothetical protein